eukprot:s755_g20.t1
MNQTRCVHERLELACKKPRKDAESNATQAVAIHVTDVLPERVRMLAVDVKLPLQSVLAAVLSEQHPAPSLRPKRSRGGVLQEGGNVGGPGDMLRREGRESLLEEAEEGAPLCTGVVSAAFPTDVLAEVCEIDAAGPEDTSAPEEGDEATPAVRRWTSPDDGWGTHLIPSDLEKMPMGMPVTVGELADFLSLACSPKAQESEEEMLDWSLEQWRAYRLKLRMEAQAQAAQTTEEKMSSSRLDLVDGPIGPVLVHRVPCAPPRPILCADDADATLLKAVQLLLAYPQCDALPVVSPVRLTVMAHLTLSCCLAFLLGRLRGEELMPLASLKVGDGSGSAPPQRKFESSTYQPSAESKEEDQEGNAPLPFMVLSQTQPLSELLCFFAKTHHSSVPIVEDEKGALVCNLSRRDLLSYLDLAMQSARQSNARDWAPDSEDLVEFNTSAPIEVLVKALRRYRVAQAQMQAPSAAPSTLQEQSLLDTLMAEAPQDPAKKGLAPPEVTKPFVILVLPSAASMAAGAAAAAERGLLRLLQRLDEKAKEESQKEEKEALDDREEREKDDTKEKTEAERAAREKDSELELRRYLTTELSELSGVWSKSESSQSSQLVRSLGEHLQRLSCALCAKAVRAFVPLQDDVQKQMAALTDAFNAWLAENLVNSELELSEEACRSMEEHLKALDTISYLRCCYRWVTSTEAKVRFLVALALVLRRALGSRETKGACLREISERLLLRFFEGGDLEASRQRCFAWLEGRLGRYDREWRRTAEKAKALGFQGELRRHVGRALEKEKAEQHSEFLELQRWPMAGCAVAKALVSFAAEYSLQSCPEHSLQPAALLHVLNELLDPFDVEESRGLQGGVRLNATWEAMKAESDAPPPQPPQPSKEEPPQPKPPLAKARSSAASNSSTKPATEAAPAKAPQPPSPKTTIGTAASPGALPDTKGPEQPQDTQDTQDTQKRSRSRSKRSSSASLQPKLLKARKTGPKEPKEPKASKDKGDAGEAQDAESQAAPAPGGSSKEKRSNSSSSEPKAKKAPPPHPNHPSHVNAGQYFYPMHWGPHMAMPGMMPGHRPGLPLTMLPQPYLMPGMPMPMGVDKKKKDKHDKHDRRKEKHRKEKEREKERDESESESAHEKKRRKKKEKAAKKDKKDKNK